MPITFDENETQARTVPPRRGFSSSAFLIKTGFVKTERGAQILLLIIAAIAVAFLVYVVTSNSVTIEPPSPEEYLVQ